jgi:hypothetical protein
MFMSRQASRAQSRAHSNLGPKIGSERQPQQSLAMEQSAAVSHSMTLDGRPASPAMPPVPETPPLVEPASPATPPVALPAIPPVAVPAAPPVVEPPLVPEPPVAGPTPPVGAVPAVPPLFAPAVPPESSSPSPRSPALRWDFPAQPKPRASVWLTSTKPATRSVHERATKLTARSLAAGYVEASAASMD